MKISEDAKMVVYPILDRINIEKNKGVKHLSTFIDNYVSEEVIHILNENNITVINIGCQKYILSWNL